MYEALEEGAIRRFLWNNAGLSRLALVVVENEQDRQGDHWSDDGKGAESP